MLLRQRLAPALRSNLRPEVGLYVPRSVGLTSPLQFCNTFYDFSLSPAGAAATSSSPSSASVNLFNKLPFNSSRQMVMRAFFSTCSTVSQKKHPPQQQSSPIDVEALATGVLAGDRRLLSRAITLVESLKPEHRKLADQLLDRLMRTADQERSHKTIRIGISGSPGAGKSTFIEAFGMYLVRQGHSVAVLSIDPSSTFTGGSILGDKTRMTNLGMQSRAYIRPSPSQGVLGGVAPATAETIELCTAAGYDFVIVETVGVGQSEINIVNLVDMNVLLVSPVSGDELQGLKKGIVEIADLVIVNKSDGDLVPAARHTKVQYMHALQMLAHSVSVRLGWEHKRGWSPSVTRVSSIDPDPDALAPVMRVVNDFHQHMRDSGQLLPHRRLQRWRWVWVQLQQDVVLRAQQLQQRQQRQAASNHVAAASRADTGRGGSGSNSNSSASSDNAVAEAERLIMEGQLTVRAAADVLLRNVMRFQDSDHHQP